MVLTLIASMPISQVDAQAGQGFSTPTVVHFGVVLLLSAVGCVPWSEMTSLGVVWGITGLGGIVYMILVTQRLWVQTAYKPVLEDHLFHICLPFVAYALVVVAAWLTRSNASLALFFVGTVALLLLLTGIHNAWDAVAYTVFVRRPQKQEAPKQE